MTTKMGRPTAEPAEKRSRPVTMLMTEAEAAAVKRAAAANGLPVSIFLRGLLLREITTTTTAA